LLLSGLAADKQVLEIGAWKGRSTIAMVRTAALIVSVDWHRGDAGSGAEWTLPDFCASLTAANAWGKVIPIVGRIEDIGVFLRSFCFGFVWIDGAHDEESVARDTYLANRVLGAGGVIAWHDWNYESVRAGVARHLNLNDCRQQSGTKIAIWEAPA
jgi:hypothetical protein